jgi:uncharacterized membrane protein YdcZ (DUF606 family)
MSARAATLVQLSHFRLRAKERQMKTATLAGIVFLVVGILALAYQGVTYTTHKKVLDVGPLKATKAEKHEIPLPPVLGCLALVGGVVLLATGAKNDSLGR